MDFSRRVDELQQRVAATKAAVQAAATESREQLRQRIGQASRTPRTPSSGHSSGPTRPATAHAVSSRR
jgi:hypothetical protein